MKTLLLAAGAVAFAAAVNLSSASAAGPKASGGDAWPGVPQTLGSELSGTTTDGRHYEWQYGYFGHHPRFEGHWVLVR